MPTRVVRNGCGPFPLADLTRANESCRSARRAAPDCRLPRAREVAKARGRRRAGPTRDRQPKPRCARSRRCSAWPAPAPRSRPGIMILPARATTGRWGWRKAPSARSPTRPARTGAGRGTRRSSWSRRRAAACATPAATMPWRTRVRHTGPTPGAATSTRRRRRTRACRPRRKRSAGPPS